MVGDLLGRRVPVLLHVVGAPAAGTSSFVVEREGGRVGSCHAIHPEASRTNAQAASMVSQSSRHSRVAVGLVLEVAGEDVPLVLAQVHDVVPALQQLALRVLVVVPLRHEDEKQSKRRVSKLS